MTRARPSVPGPVAPTPDSERLLAPDLARGVMLLLIALAHSRMLHAGGNAYNAPAGGGPLDVAVQALLTSLVDGRAAPLFGFLFGYGLVQMTRRYSGPGGDPAGARRLIRRRGFWLIVFGVVHVVLLYSGDVIGSYGVISLLFAGAVAWSGRRLWAAAAVVLVVGAALAAVIQLGGGSEPPLPVGATLIESALVRMTALPVLPVAAIAAAAPVFIGIWAARMRLLEQPGRFRPLLRGVALIGFPVAVLGALPVTLQAVDVWHPQSSTVVAAGFALFSATGIAGGLAYAATIALVAVRVGNRRGRVTTALVACGRRSMTFYIAQSPVWLVLTEPSLVGLHGELGAATAAGIGVAAWVATVLVAGLLHRSGRRGPAEALIRRLTYRHRTTSGPSGTSSRRNETEPPTERWAAPDHGRTR
ncbi:DUF418 domain-containing protein [Pseudonocardia sp. KRD291]|uniref:DUF418 domain-containing protein n=1 Tax=Pseudonocardia sp. KRD291 TaxID=2792007 RepID=UPI001C4A5D64|nr:DUF418 domain-containing protein [Pseudonocardia sp. KRD291]MBW0105568.1 DUF418 domain-containing protein [Pseudonocardia sp. KRD291]